MGSNVEVAVGGRDLDDNGVKDFVSGHIAESGAENDEEQYAEGEGGDPVSQHQLVVYVEVIEIG